MQYLLVSSTTSSLPSYIQLSFHL